MNIKRVGSQPSTQGPSEWFTGTVRIDPLFPAMEGSVVSGALVTFEPGARSAWHTHPMGQNLIVVSGMGWTRCEGGPKVEIRPGDVVSCPCGKRHWHGATPTTAMNVKTAALENNGRKRVSIFHRLTLRIHRR